MSKFLKTGSVVTVVPDEDLQVTDRLTAGNYVVKFHVQKGYYLEQIETFSEDKKIYGQVDLQAQRYFKTYMSRDENTGILLCGNKGSGKTFLAKMLSDIANDNDIPTIIINDPFEDTNFMSLIHNVDHRCIVLFDEFEKNFDIELQDRLLTMLDGTITGNKLFVFTANDKYRISDHMVNRPSRILYFIEYEGIESDFIQEYCEENLKDKTQTESILSLRNIFRDFNFDMLQSLIEEMNRYDITMSTAIKDLNIKQEFTIPQSFKITAYYKNRELHLPHPYVEVNPLKDGFHFQMRGWKEPTDEPCGAGHSMYVEIDELTKYDRETYTYTYLIEGEYRVEITKTERKTYNHDF